MPSLANLHAVITGGSRGIGLAIAQRFASDGASITLVGRDEARLQTALEALPPRGPESESQHCVYAFDVGKMHGWGELQNELKQVSRRGFFGLVWSIKRTWSANARVHYGSQRKMLISS